MEVGFLNNKKNNKRFDFLPNRINKYSIRKFSNGIASALVGALMVIALSNDNKAEASEEQQVVDFNKVHQESNNGNVEISPAREEIKPSIDQKASEPVQETEDVKPEVSSEDSKVVQETEAVKPEVNREDKEAVQEIEEVKPEVNREDKEVVQETEAVKPEVNREDKEAVQEIEEVKPEVNTEDKEVVQETEAEKPEVNH
ncbi:hypothetical protein BUY94_09095 [Mammaliicoccus fleurettii]|nr:hypothetical protein BUY94_09095 [Mammaliicoccus fleurettii]